MDSAAVKGAPRTARVPALAPTQYAERLGDWDGRLHDPHVDGSELAIRELATREAIDYADLVAWLGPRLAIFRGTAAWKAAQPNREGELAWLAAVEEHGARLGSLLESVPPRLNAELWTILHKLNNPAQRASALSQQARAASDDGDQELASVLLSAARDAAAAGNDGSNDFDEIRKRSLGDLRALRMVAASARRALKPAPLGRPAKKARDVLFRELIDWLKPHLTKAEVATILAADILRKCGVDVPAQGAKGTSNLAKIARKRKSPAL